MSERSPLRPHNLLPVAVVRGVHPNYYLYDANAQRIAGPFRSREEAGAWCRRNDFLLRQGSTEMAA